jgi:hypothetical protein
MTVQAEIDRLTIEVREWERKYKALEVINQDLNGQLLKIKARTANGKGLGAGWVAYSPNPNYNGLSCGIRFVNGVGFIQRDVERGELIVKELENDFGFKVEEVKEFKDIPEVAQKEIKSNIAEVLSQPTSAVGIVNES